MSRYQKFSCTYFAAIAKDITHIVERFERGFRIGNLLVPHIETLNLPCYSNKLITFKHYYLCVDEMIVTVVRSSTLTIYNTLQFQKCIADVRISWSGDFFCVIGSLDVPSFVCDENGIKGELLVAKKMLRETPLPVCGSYARFGDLVYYTGQVIYLKDEVLYKCDNLEDCIIDCCLTIDGNVCALIYGYRSVSMRVEYIQQNQNHYCFPLIDQYARSIALSEDGYLLVANDIKKLLKINTHFL